MVELLAPAGSMEALRSAVESGADAVYLAGNHFGARAYADNFDEDTLCEAVRYAHLRDVRIHVTVNTIVRDEEMDALRSYLRFLDEAGVDAVLVQDLGVARLAREVAPGLPLHASTQMSVTSLEGVRALARIGFVRVVLAREMSLKEIAYICHHSPIEIETFMHGALCVCYSGECLMSSMIGGRSGNRGRCAQPCRLPYRLVDEDGHDVLEGKAGEYLLSPRDLNTIDVLPQLIEAGVSSLKIEGRMKRPEYVHTVVSTYRKAIDSFYAGRYDVTKEMKDDLAQIFNRDFTTAYLLGKPGKDMMSDKRPNNRGLLTGRILSYDKDKGMVSVRLQGRLSVGDQVEVWVKVGGRVRTTIERLLDQSGRDISTAGEGDTVSFPLVGRVNVHDRIFKIFDARLMEEAKTYAAGGAPIRRIPVDIAVHAVVGEHLTITLSDREGNSGIGKTDFIGEQARKRPLSKETVERQVARLGTSPFSIASLSIEIEGDVMVPVSEINEARRRAVESLEQVRLSAISREPGRASDDVTVREPPRRKASLMVTVDSLEKEKAAIEAGADGILFGGVSYVHQPFTEPMYASAVRLARENDVRIDFDTPCIVKEDDMQRMEHLLGYFEQIAPDAIHLHNIGMLSLARRMTTLPLHADYSLISFNKETLAFLKDYGVSEATASPELNFEQLGELAAKSPLPLSAICHGRLELMVSEYCVVGSFLGGVGSGKCSMPCRTHHFGLKDRKEAVFPLAMDETCHMHILNSKTLSTLPHTERFKAIGISTLRIEARAMTAEEIAKIVRAYRTESERKGRHSGDEAEKAVWQSEWAAIEGKDITRGHYFRGVE